MSDQEINKAIAEALGWSQVRSAGHNDDLIGKPPTNAPPTGGTLVRGGWILPDFSNDLNAMHAAEEILTPDNCLRMERELSKTCGVAGGIGSGTLSEMVWHCSARQRAEAFLRTLGKWRLA